MAHANAVYPGSVRPCDRLVVPARLHRAGLEMRLVIDGPGQPANTDANLIRLIARSHRMLRHADGGHQRQRTQLADAEGVTTSYFTRVMRLAVLAPDITRAILDGRLPPELTAATLLHHGRLPLAGDEHRAVLGFG